MSKNKTALEKQEEYELYEEARSYLLKYLRSGEDTDLEPDVESLKIFEEIIKANPSISKVDPRARSLEAEVAMSNARDDIAVECLLVMNRAGRDLSEPDIYLGNSFLHWMIANDKNDRTLLFFDKYLEEDVKTPININALDWNNITPLFLAICKKCYSGEHSHLRESDDKVIGTLLDMGADITIRDNIRGFQNNVLHIACLKRDEDMLKVLLSRPEAEELLNQENAQGQVPAAMFNMSHSLALGILQRYYKASENDIILPQQEWEEIFININKIRRELLREEEESEDLVTDIDDIKIEDEKCQDTFFQEKEGTVIKPLSIKSVDPTNLEQGCRE